MSKKTGIELIAEERQRQIEAKGYDKDHDDMETAFQLSSAAALYICNAQNQDFKDHTHYDDKGDVTRFQMREIDSKKWGAAWPWEDHNGRIDSDILTSLVKAGALIVAEIERYNRLIDQQ